MCRRHRPAYWYTDARAAATEAADVRYRLAALDDTRAIRLRVSPRRARTIRRHQEPKP